MGGEPAQPLASIPIRAARSAQADFARQAAAGLWWAANGAAEAGHHAQAERLLHNRQQLLDGARANLGVAARSLADLV